MKKTSFHRVLLAATAGLILGSVERAVAQYPASNQNGHAQDASNRVGSNGDNGKGNSGGAVTQNNIIYRNVTGLGGFSGPIHERDAGAFSGPTAGGVNDAFVRRSNGVAGFAGASSTYGRPQPYYSDARFVAPPTGALPVGFNGGYIGTALDSESSLSTGLNMSAAAGGLQSRTENRDNLLLNAMLNPTGYGGLNSAGNDNAALQAAFISGHTLLAQGENNAVTLQYASQMGIDGSSILRMRQELRDAVEPAGLNLAQKANGLTQSSLQPNGQAAPPVGLNQPINRAVGQPLESPSNLPVTGGLTPSQIANDPMSSTGIFPANMGQRPSLIPANMQSTLLDTLRQRMERSTDVGKAMVEARSDTPQHLTPAAQSGRPAQPNPLSPSDEAPLKVSHLATGVKAKGLHDLLTDGEELITAGKYDSAIAKFNYAQLVAPNNPLTVLGRANAELGGGYYARAERDLRLVFRTNRELLLAQFDLKSLFPREREDYLRKDLKGLAASDPKAVRPWFLLAYLDYNTDKPKSAEIDLNEAEKRVGRGDASIRLLKQNWTLPSNPHPTHAAPQSTVPPRP